jgi:hypothetical protein
LLVPWSANAELPPDGECPEVTLEPTGRTPNEDTVAILIKPGMVLTVDDLLVLRQLVPNEIWAHREIFFHEGMRLEIGPCHRRYPVPKFYREATEKFRGQSEIDRKGNLQNYTAGLPFVPEEIDPEDEQAAIKWAYALDNRYRGAGSSGKFRISDFPNRMGSVATYEGEFYLLQTGHRADLPETDYRVPKTDMDFAAGGEFFKPFDARHLKWRQFRPQKAARRYTEPDDIFTYIPTMRKMRRAATNWVDGLYVPNYMISGDSGGGPVATGGDSSINPTAGRSIATSEDLRRGLTGIIMRPNAFDWRLVGERSVLAPINVNNPGFPTRKDRHFGYSGFSLADDRWDVRYAMVIEGASKLRNRDVNSVLIYVDYQTLQPLYWITRTDRRRLLDVGILGHRFSDDAPELQLWPNGSTASVFEPVVALFFSVAQGSGGWRRESYELRSTPFTKNQVRNMTSVDVLLRGR